MNIEKLLEIKEVILAHPKQFDMCVFFDDIEDDTLNILDGGDNDMFAVCNPVHSCKTFACIAGWALALDHKSDKVLSEFQVQDRAQEILGLTGSQVKRLFFHEDWHRQFMEDNGMINDYGDIMYPTAQQGADYIDYFIKVETQEQENDQI